MRAFDISERSRENELVLPTMNPQPPPHQRPTHQQLIGTTNQYRELSTRPRNRESAAMHNRRETREMTRPASGQRVCQPPNEIGIAAFGECYAVRGA